MGYNQKLLEKCRRQDFKQVLESKGYKYFQDGDMNLNIIGVRSPLKGNEFNDAICVEYWKKDNKYTYIAPCTTDPGYKSLAHPQNIKGCAILVPGQYRGCYKIGFHKGQYEALVQCKPVKVYRDNNRDFFLDFDPATIEEGMFGINIHKAGISSTVVDGWSAGCTVFAKSAYFEHFMLLAKLSESKYGNSFTYTLLEEKDLK